MKMKNSTPKRSEKSEGNAKHLKRKEGSKKGTVLRKAIDNGGPGTLDASMKNLKKEKKLSKKNG